jgi:hypothetical protein
MLCTAEPTVASSLLSTMSEFPMALPLIVRNVKDNSFNVLLSLLQGITIKWDAGKIIENSLFIDKFSLLVAVRLGDNPIGKSTILNQLFTKDHVFSSAAEPGAEYGRATDS